MTLDRFEKAIAQLKKYGKKGPYRAWINTPKGMVMITGKSAKKLWKKYKKEWEK